MSCEYYRTFNCHMREELKITGDPQIFICPYGGNKTICTIYNATNTTILHDSPDVRPEYFKNDFYTKVMVDYDYWKNFILTDSDKPKSHEYVYEDSEGNKSKFTPVDNHFGRSPFNISLNQFILEQGKIFYKWLYDNDYFTNRYIKAGYPDRKIEIPIDNLDINNNTYIADDHEVGETCPFMVDSLGKKLDPYFEMVYEKDGKLVEIPQFYPISSDNMIVNKIDSSVIPKLPMMIGVKVRIKTPASTGTGNPTVSHNQFHSRNKREYKMRKTGLWERKDDNGNVIEVLQEASKRWEATLEYTIISPDSETKVMWLEEIFYRFLQDCEGIFIKLGIDKSITRGFYYDPTSDKNPLDRAGLHYRKIWHWYRTQEFRLLMTDNVIKSVNISN